MKRGCCRRGMRFRRLVAAAALGTAVCATGPLDSAAPAGTAGVALEQAPRALISAGCAADAADRQRERDRRELAAVTAAMEPRHARTMADDERRRLERRRARAEREQRARSGASLWPGILQDSALGIDQSPAERVELRRRLRAQQGVGALTPLLAALTVCPLAPLAAPSPAAP